MEKFLYTMTDLLGPGGAGWLVFTGISLFRIFKWLFPGKKCGRFVKYMPYSRLHKVAIWLTPVLLIAYIVILIMDKNVSIGPMLLRIAMMLTWLITILLPDKQYENGILKWFRFEADSVKAE